MWERRFFPPVEEATAEQLMQNLMQLFNHPTLVLLPFPDDYPEAKKEKAPGEWASRFLAEEQLLPGISLDRPGAIALVNGFRYLEYIQWKYNFQLTDPDE